VCPGVCRLFARITYVLGVRLHFLSNEIKDFVFLLEIVWQASARYVTRSFRLNPKLTWRVAFTAFVSNASCTGLKHRRLIHLPNLQLLRMCALYARERTHILCMTTEIITSRNTVFLKRGEIT